MSWAAIIPFVLLTAGGAGQAATAEPVPLEAQAFYFAISVADVEVSSAWYARVFGFETVRRMDVAKRGLKIRLMRVDGAYLELGQMKGSVGLGELQPPVARRFLLQGVFKIGFLVHDLDAAVRRLAALEVPLRGSIIDEDDIGLRSLQVEDPDGNVVQVFEVLATDAE